MKKKMKSYLMDINQNIHLQDYLSHKVIFIYFTHHLTILKKNIQNNKNFIYYSINEKKSKKNITW